MVPNNCDYCRFDVRQQPLPHCQRISHYNIYGIELQDQLHKCQLQLEMRDEDRDKLDVADWLKKRPKTKSYDCHGCGRHYELPIHLTIVHCVCGAHCRLRHVGGIDENQAVIDACVALFGNERATALAWIAELIVSEQCHWDITEIKKTIKQEMNRWTLNKQGWKRS